MNIKLLKLWEKYDKIFEKVFYVIFRKIRYCVYGGVLV